MNHKKLIVLFDESGTPAIGQDVRSAWFLGISVVYDLENEEYIFTECENEFGLRNARPLKNDRISASRVVRLVSLLGSMPLSVFVSGVNATDASYRTSISKYMLYGNKARRTFRNVRERPVAQIMHDHVLEHSLFNSITDYFEGGGDDAEIEIYIDDWSIPKADAKIALQQRSMSLQKEVFDLCTKFSFGRPRSISPLVLLDTDSDRKRFIDVVTSVFSRAFLRTGNPRYSGEVSRILKQGKNARFEDATVHMIDVMESMIRRYPNEK